MSFEKNIERIADALERLADRYDGIADDANPPAGKKPGKDKGKEKEKPAGKKDSSAPKLTVVRKALADLQKRETSDAARKILKDVGGVATLSKLSEEKYQDVIDAANEKE